MTDSMTNGPAANTQATGTQATSTQATSTQAASTHADEAAVGRRYLADIAWPTLRLAAGVYLGLIISIWAALTGVLPYWLSAVINGVILYGAYTVVHEAIHHNIVPKRPGLRWLNGFIGHAICPLLWLFYFPHKKSHMLHHRKCNSEEDPDIYSRGPFGVVTFWRIPMAALGQLNPMGLFRDFDRFQVNGRERFWSLVTQAAYWGLVAGLIAVGFGYELLVLWFIPWFFGYSVMLIFFTWVPHHPHSAIGRYRDTRISIWPLANFLVQGQHMHLIHHMMPWIPYYHYEKVFNELRPGLEANGVVIDGFWPRTEIR